MNTVCRSALNTVKIVQLLSIGNWSKFTYVLSKPLTRYESMTYLICSHHQPFKEPGGQNFFQVNGQAFHGRTGGVA